MENGMEEKERPHSCIFDEDLISKDGCQGIVGSERSLLNSSVVLSAGSSSSNSSCKDETSGNSSNNDTKSVHCSQNGRKKRPHNKFLGVRQRPSGRWVAEIKDASQKLRVWLGTFDSAEDAARAYDDAARFLRGKNTRTNFAENNNSRNMQGRSSSSSKVARFLLLRHALAKTTQKNSNCTGKNHDGGATVFPQVAYHCNNISTSNKNIISISNSVGFPMGLSASASACYNQVITNSMTNAGVQLSHSLLSNTQGHPKAAATTTSTTQTALLSNDTFDRFCTSGWTLKLQEVNHEQKSNSSNQSQRKTGSTVRVAPSFNASLYSETEKWYQNPAVLLSRDHTSLL